jgi:serine/threonine protein kinase
MGRSMCVRLVCKCPCSAPCRHVCLLPHRTELSSPAQISILRRLNHPNIISLVEVPEIDPPPAPVRTLYVVFDFAGCDLHKLAQNNTVIPLETVKTLMKQMCMATRYLHHCCVIHRDLKPANILIDPKTWRLRIADFGLSRVLDQGQVNTH